MGDNAGYLKMTAIPLSPPVEYVNGFQESLDIPRNAWMNLIVMYIIDRKRDICINHRIRYVRSILLCPFNFFLNSDTIILYPFIISNLYWFEG